MRINYEELEKLGKLKEQGILTNEEFEIEKKRILNSEEKNESLDQRNISQEENTSSNIVDTYYTNKHNTIKEIFNSKGRIGNKLYLIQVIIFIFIFVLLNLINNYSIFLDIVSSLFLLGLIIILIFLIIKRLHDLNLPGYYLIGLGIFILLRDFLPSYFDRYSIFEIFIIPIIVIIGFIPGTKGDNKYGPEPK